MATSAAITNKPGSRNKIVTKAINTSAPLFNGLNAGFEGTRAGNVPIDEQSTTLTFPLNHGPFERHYGRVTVRTG
jgi:hypothetical protein